MALANTYADGSHVEVRDGKLVVVRPDGTVIEGAVPTVTGTGRGYTSPVTSLQDLPAGSFDPSLTYQSQNANLGQLYNAQDFQTAWRGYDPNHLDQQPTDLSSVGQNVQDYYNQRSALAQALARAQQDYQQSTQTLARNYNILGNNQLQGAEAAGTAEGGALAQALAKRTENQGRDQSGLDQSLSRYQQDNSQALSNLTQGFQRAYATGNVNLQRGSESNALYQGGLFGSAAAMANQSGMLADNPNYKTHNGVLYQVMPDGTSKPVSGTASGGSTQKAPAATTFKSYRPKYTWGGRTF